MEEKAPISGDDLQTAAAPGAACASAAPAGDGNQRAFSGGAAGTTLLEVENVGVVFGNLAAVRGASFSLRAGSLLGLVGPNGAGKTTLLRAIATLQVTASGRISMLGEPVSPGSEHAARLIGFTPDVPPLYESLTVRRFLDFIAAGYGLTPENTGPAIDFWLEKVWLSDKAGQKIRGLSRRMKQRLGIARTLLPNPTIILLDEPAAGLDPAGRAQFRRLLCDLRDQGKTLIVSSHFLADMEEYCTHIAIMSRGAIVKFGSIREISSGADDGRCGYTLELAEPLAGLAEMLAGIEGVSHVQAQRLRITLDYWSDKRRAAELLRLLVAKGLPMAGFSANAAGLEEAYLRTATTAGGLMIGSSRSYAIGMAHFHIGGGVKAILIICGVYLLLWGAGISIYEYIDMSTGMRTGLTSFAVSLLFVFEAVVLVVFGCFRVSGAIRTDISSRMIESHRLMPIPNWRALAGYLLGGATPAIAFGLLNLALAFILGGVTKTSLTQIALNQVILFAFAALTWSFAALITFLFRYLFFIGLAALVVGSCSGVVLYAYLMLPGLTLLMSPLFDQTIFVLGSKSPDFQWCYPASIAAQGVFFGVFFAGACRRYRGTYFTTFSLFQAMILLAAWSAASALGLELWEKLTPFRGMFGPSGSGDETLRMAQRVASLLAAMVVALIPLGTLSVERTRKMVHAWFVAPLLILCAAAIWMVALGALPDKQIRAAAPWVTLLAAGAHVSAVYAAFRLMRRMRMVYVWLIIGGGMACLWLLPLILELVRYMLAGDQSSQLGFGFLGTLSPLGLLVSAWTAEKPFTPIPGLALQWCIAGVLALLLIPRKVSVPPVVAPVVAAPPVPAEAGKSGAEMSEM